MVSKTIYVLFPIVRKRYADSTSRTRPDGTTTANRRAPMKKSQEVPAGSVINLDNFECTNPMPDPAAPTFEAIAEALALSLPPQASNVQFQNAIYCASGFPAGFGHSRQASNSSSGDTHVSNCTHDSNGTHVTNGTHVSNSSYLSSATDYGLSEDDLALLPRITDVSSAHDIFNFSVTDLDTDSYLDAMIPCTKTGGSSAADAVMA